MGAQDLIKRYGAKQATFTIDLMTINDETGKPEVDTLTVKQLKSAEEMTALKVLAMQFFKMLQNNPHPDFKPFLSISEETADKIIAVSELVLEPKFSQLDALVMQRDAGQLLAHIYGQIMARNLRCAGLAEKDAIEEAKKQLAQDPSPEATLPSEGIASENTPNASTTTIGDTPASSLPSNS